MFTSSILLLVANHGGRFLYVDQDNQLKEDTNYNMTRSPEDLASAGSVFALDDKNQIVSYETGKPVRLSDDSSTYPLILEKIDDGEASLLLTGIYEDECC